VLEFPFSSVEKLKNKKISTRDLHKNYSAKPIKHSIIDNIIGLGDNEDHFAINSKDNEYTINTDEQISRDDKELHDYNEYEYEDENDKDLNYRTGASLRLSEHNFVEVFDELPERNIHKFDSQVAEDIIVTPMNHNGKLPYHLEGTVGRQSKQTKAAEEYSGNTANVNFAFKEFDLFNNEKETPSTNIRIRGALKHETSVDGIIRFNRREKISSSSKQNQLTETSNKDRESRQGSDQNSPPAFGEVASARPDNSGQKCINKVVLETETQYDNIVECKHSYDKRCHTTFTTDYEPTQEEKCDENFRKNCFIEYSTTAYNETVQICREPLLKDCNISGPEICRTEYESECWTRNEAHDVTDDVVECTEVKEQKCEDETSGYTTQQKCSVWPVQKCEIQSKPVKKFSPRTKCTKVPREVCAPAGCGLSPGPEECYDRVQTVLGQHPEEQCSLEPHTTCKHVTKLVPKLVAREECLDVPKEVCTRSRSNPRKVQKPVVKKWCYTPSEESGLA